MTINNSFPDPTERCEGCGAEATKHDSDRVPLCQECYDEMVRDFLRRKQHIPKPKGKRK